MISFVVNGRWFVFARSLIDAVIFLSMGGVAVC